MKSNYSKKVKLARLKAEYKYLIESAARVGQRYYITELARYIREITKLSGEIRIAG